MTDHYAPGFHSENRRLNTFVDTQTAIAITNRKTDIKKATRIEDVATRAAELAYAKQSLTNEVIYRYTDHGATVTDLARSAGVTRPTIYKWLAHAGIRTNEDD